MLRTIGLLMGLPRWDFRTRRIPASVSSKLPHVPTDTPWQSKQ